MDYTSSTHSALSAKSWVLARPFPKAWHRHCQRRCAIRLGKTGAGCRLTCHQAILPQAEIKVALHSLYPGRGEWICVQCWQWRFTAQHNLHTSSSLLHMQHAMPGIVKGLPNRGQPRRCNNTRHVRRGKHRARTRLYTIAWSLGGRPSPIHRVARDAPPVAKQQERHKAQQQQQTGGGEPRCTRHGCVVVTGGQVSEESSKESYPETANQVKSSV